MSKTPKRRGRPKDSSGKAKHHSVLVRIDSDEKLAFGHCAKAAGITLSAWIRERLRQAARREFAELGEQIPFVPSMSKFLEELKNG